VQTGPYGRKRVRVQLTLLAFVLLLTFSLDDRLLLTLPLLIPDPFPLGSLPSFFPSQDIYPKSVEIAWLDVE